ncbi:hypothetical protein [Dongshaea marina]|uniref:hypothetical protein n=1 Tax=Dongshaea marina TaxID=2047966 RepID=UPI000D3EB3F5|nr:hypothetical protein [Dongshaea marina]
MSSIKEQLINILKKEKRWLTSKEISMIALIPGSTVRNCLSSINHIDVISKDETGSGYVSYKYTNYAKNWEKLNSIMNSHTAEL